MLNEHRGGLADTLRLPVQWFIDQGDTLRAEFPTFRRLELYRVLELPPKLMRQRGKDEGSLEHASAAFLVARLGHKPGMIRVKGIAFSGGWSPHIADMPNHLGDDLYRVDDPEGAAEDDPAGDYLGVGGSVHRWLREQCFVFWNGNDWWVTGLTGDVEST